MTFQDIFDAAQTLPADERVQLIHALWDSVSADDWPSPSEAWIAESQRRSDELDAGCMPTAPWDDVRARVRRKAGLDG